MQAVLIVLARSVVAKEEPHQDHALTVLECAVLVSTKLEFYTNSDRLI